MIDLEPALLKTFVAIVETGRLTKAKRLCSFWVTKGRDYASRAAGPPPAGWSATTESFLDAT